MDYDIEVTDLRALADHQRRLFCRGAIANADEERQRKVDDKNRGHEEGPSRDTQLPGRLPGRFLGTMPKTACLTRASAEEVFRLRCLLIHFL